MDYGLLLIFMAASFWLYGAIVMGLNDWRWNAGRILQYALCAGIGAEFVNLWRQPTAVHYHRTLLGTTLILVVLTIFLPGFIQRRMIAALIAGRIRLARLWQFLLVIFMWRRPSTLFGGLPNATPDAAEGSPQARRTGHMLARIYASMSRRAFVHHKVEALVASGFYPQAIALFESSINATWLSPEQPIFYAMAVAYSEANDLRHATAMLLQAEETAPGPHPSDLRRFTASLSVYSACGQVEQLERFIEYNPFPTQLVPPAAIRYRMGLAYLHAGDVATCSRMLIEAMGLIRPGENGLYNRIREHFQTLPEAAEPVTLDSQTETTLQRLALLGQHPLPIPTAPSPPARAVVTWAFIIAMVLVWIITETVGSSQDGRTLMQLGANVSMLVQYGEWWRLVSSVFLHAGFLHLFFNAYACAFFGAFVERATGRWQLFVLFLASGITGSIASAFLGTHTMSVGASGGIFGLVGAATVIALRFKNLFAPRVRRFLVINFLFIAAISVFSGVVEPHIDNLAHGGGFAAGVVLGFLLRRPDDHRGSTGIFKPIGIVLLAVLVIASVQQVRYAIAGPYPEHLPLFRTVISKDQGWKVEVPVLWEYMSPNPNKTVFLDPLMTQLTIERQDAVPGENKGFIFPKKRLVGTVTYGEMDGVVSTPNGRLAKYLFQRPFGDYDYIIAFQCPLEDVNAYQPLLTRILDGLEIAPPSSDNAPDQPATKNGS